MPRSSTTQIRREVSRLTRNRPTAASAAARRYREIVTPIEMRRKNPEYFVDLSTAIKHLTYHICPFANSSDSWRWNLDQLRTRWHLFNGMKIIGINHDETTVTPDELLAYCASIGMQWDRIVIRQNERGLGEVLTWIPSLELLRPESAAPNEVVFSAHAKGVKYGSKMPPIIRDWSHVMYAANLDDWPHVQSSLEWFSATGAFRARYRRTANCRNGWYYSGAFWWWRLGEIGKRSWRHVGPWYAGRELWIGNQLRKDEADCLFLDNCRSPYLPAYWRSVINPRWKEFTNAR